MSIKIKKERMGKRLGLGIYATHPWGPPAAAPKTGRMTPKGRVHSYKTITLMGKKTQIPVARFLPLSDYFANLSDSLVNLLAAREGTGESDAV